MSTHYTPAPPQHESSGHPLDAMLDGAYISVCDQWQDRGHNTLYLKPLDDEMSKHGFYARFMDDWAVMVKTKHQLRKVIKLTHKILDQLKLKMHPDKTFIGCIKKGFDFLGVHFCDAPEISKTSLNNHRSKLAQRYAQGASAACIGLYKARWTSWCAGVLKCCNSSENNPMGREANRNHGLMEQTMENHHENFCFENTMETALYC